MLLSSPKWAVFHPDHWICVTIFQVCSLGIFLSAECGCYLFLGSLLSKRIFVRRKASSYLVLVKITLGDNWPGQFVAHGKSYCDLFQKFQLFFWRKCLMFSRFNCMTSCHLQIWGNPLCFFVVKKRSQNFWDWSVSGWWHTGETFGKQPAEWFQSSEDYASLRGVFPYLGKL